MTDERIDIEITDKISPAPAKKLREIATEAVKADSAIDRLKISIAEIDASALTKLANASSRLTNAQAREVSATARLESARAKMATATSRAAINEQKLATETARTEAAQARASSAASQAAAAEARAEAASLRLAAAKQRQTAATQAATAATQLHTAAQRANAASSGLASHQLGNMVHQVNDVGVSLASGQNPLIVMIQQGSQIASIYGPGTGLTTIMRGFGQAIFSIARQFAPVLIAAGAAAGAFGILTNEINKTTDVSVTMGDTVKATFQVIGENIYDVLQPAINAIAPWFKRAYDFIVDATKVVINNIAGAFVGTYNVVKILWGTDLPTLFELAWKTAANTLLDIMQAAGTGVINLFKGVINTTVGLFKGGFDAVVAVWGLLPAAFERLGALAMNGMITVVETGVRGIISALDSIFTFIGQAAELVGAQNPFTDLFNPDNIDLSRFRQEVGAPVGGQMAEAITSSFTNALSTDYAAGLVDALDASQYRFELGEAAQGTADAINQAYEQAFSVDYAGSLFQRIREQAIENARARIAAENEADGASLTRKQEILAEIQKPLHEYIEDTAALNELLSEGAITLGQYNQALASLQLVRDLRDVDASLVGTPFADAAQVDEIRIAEQERLNIVQQALEARIISEQEAADRIVAINRQAATEIQAIESDRRAVLLAGASETFGSLANAARDFAGEQSAAYKVLFAASKAFAIAESIIKIQQGIATALSLPFPANIPAMASVAAAGASIISSIQSVAGIGFMSGGYTGNGPTTGVAGVVHGKEYVMNAQATRSIGVSALDKAQRTGRLPTGKANRVDAVGTTNVGLNVNIQNYGSGKEFEVQQVTENDVIVIARDVAKQVVRDDAPGVVSADMGNPNGKVSRALTQNTNATRKR